MSYVITAEMKRQYRQDGVVKLPQLLDAGMLASVKACFDWTLGNPGPQFNQFTKDGDNINVGDYANPNALSFYAERVAAMPFKDALKQLWGSEHVWYYGEEIFWKKGRAPGTNWHQDTSYLPWGGDHWVNCWISLDPLPAQNSIGVIRGSQRGTLYDGNQFDPENPTEPFWGDRAKLPRIPDINAELGANPASWDVVKFDVMPGDVVCFHPGTIHGGAPANGNAPERRTLVLRFFGDQAFWSDLLKGQENVKDMPAFNFDVGADGGEPGKPFRGSQYLQLG